MSQSGYPDSWAIDAPLCCIGFAVLAATVVISKRCWRPPA